MKCEMISIGNTFPTDNRTMEQFVGLPEANSPFGKLAIALARETAWSAEYTFIAHIYGEDPSLLIYHPVFFRGIGNSLIFRAKAEEDISAHGVENAVRAYLYKIHEDLRPGIVKLQQDASDLIEAALQIVVKKAWAAIAAVFHPEAYEIKYLPIQAVWPGLYAFEKNGNDFLYVARAVDNEIVGGLAKIRCSFFDWDRTSERTRYDLFWSELARRFAIRYLGIPESEVPHRGDVYAKEKSLEFRISKPKGDPYVVEKVVFRITDDDCAIVEFGPDNLPAKAYVATPPGRVAVLADGHIHP